jgi:nicotinamidase-related amidase
MTDSIDPRRAALLVMDYQNGIVDRLGEPDELLSQASEAIATVRRAGGHVSYVRVVRKVRVGAFSTTDLDAQLRERGVDTLILAGISTSGVVLSTVRDASDRDYRVLVLADATADPEPDVHAFLTERIFPRQADVITVGDLDDLLPGS